MEEDKEEMNPVEDEEVEFNFVGSKKPKSKKTKKQPKPIVVGGRQSIKVDMNFLRDSVDDKLERTLDDNLTL